MKLTGFGVTAYREWFQQILEWSKKRVNFLDNIDCVIISANINTVETIIGHNLGRTPVGIIPIAQYPYGTDKIEFTKESEVDKIYVKRATAGYQALLLF